MNKGSSFYDLSNAARLLKYTFPDGKWELFLSKNINGLTDGYSPIPFDKDRTDFHYELNDLRKFAIEYGRENGNLHPEAITTIINTYVKSGELLHKLDEQNMISHAFDMTSDFISKKKFNADGTVDLSLENLAKWMIAIKEISDAALSASWALASFAEEFYMHSVGNELSAQKAAELSERAIDQAVKICDGSEQIKWILN